MIVFRCYRNLLTRFFGLALVLSSTNLFAEESAVLEDFLVPSERWQVNRMELSGRQYCYLRWEWWNAFGFLNMKGIRSRSLIRVTPGANGWMGSVQRQTDYYSSTGRLEKMEWVWGRTTNRTVFMDAGTNWSSRISTNISFTLPGNITNNVTTSVWGGCMRKEPYSNVSVTVWRKEGVFYTNLDSNRMSMVSNPDGSSFFFSQWDYLTSWPYRDSIVRESRWHSDPLRLIRVETNIEVRISTNNHGLPETNLTVKYAFSDSSGRFLCLDSYGPSVLALPVSAGVTNRIFFVLKNAELKDLTGLRKAALLHSAWLTATRSGRITPLPAKQIGILRTERFEYSEGLLRKRKISSRKDLVWQEDRYFYDSTGRPASVEQWIRPVDSSTNEKFRLLEKIIIELQ